MAGGILSGAAIALSVALIFHNTITRELFNTAFPAGIYAGGQFNAALAGFGMGIPYPIFASAAAFVLLFPFLDEVALKELLRAPVRQIVSGVIAWATPAFIFLVATILSPPFADPVLSERAAFIFAPGFAVLQALMGSIGGIITWLVARLILSFEGGEPSDMND
jgi:hypothetical protein